MFLDPPITIKWQKNGKPLGEFYQFVQVVSITEFASSLIITNISRDHSGRYSCIASNNVATTNFTAVMVVKAAPMWIIKPSDMFALSGSAGRFDCSASGFPQPVIRWKFIKPNGGSEGSAILSSPHMHVLENGSLSIRAVDEQDEGVYLCESNNGVGKTLEASAKLTVHSVPVLKSQYKQVLLRKQERTQFSCACRGSAPLVLEWLKDGLKLPENDRYVIREEENANNKVSFLTIIQGMRNDSALFTCVATNLYGSESMDINVLVQEQPDAPINVKLLDIGSRTVTFTWDVPFNGNSAILQHELEYKRKSGESLFYAFCNSKAADERQANHYLLVLKTFSWGN